MFGNKILMINFVKLSKNKVRHKATMSFSLCNAKSSNLSHQKMRDCAFFKINGFCDRLLLSENSWEIIKIRKCLSYISEDRCWNCKQSLERKKFTCALCGALQYPKKNMSYFEILGISQMYDVDLEDLSKKFKDLQKIFHPDKFANKSPEELQISESYSRLINKAYTTLKDPLGRGLYMLELQKIKSDSNYELEPDFLMFIMEKNEELDCLDNLNSLKKFMEGNFDEINQKILEISEAFRHSNLDKAKINLMKLSYFINLDKRVKEKQSKISMNEDPV